MSRDPLAVTVRYHDLSQVRTYALIGQSFLREYVEVLRSTGQTRKADDVQRTQRRLAELYDDFLAPATEDRDAK